MSCNQPPFLVRTTSEDDLNFRPWASVDFTDDRWLVVSNAPELINPGAITEPGPVILYRTNDAVDVLGTGDVDMRVFLWHKNIGSGVGDTRYIHIVLKPLEGQSLSLSNHKVQDNSGQPAGGDLSIPGQCIAAAHLFGTVDADGSNASGPDGQIVLGSHPMPAGHYVLAVHEFTVGGTANKKFQVRTILTDSSSASGVGDGSEAVLDPGQHIRGSWKHAAMDVTGDSVDVAPPLPNIPDYHYRLSDAQGLDYNAYKKRTDDTYGKDNKGLYGVNINYKVPITNTTGSIRYCLAELKPHGYAAKKLWGAARDISNNMDRRVPKLLWDATVPEDDRDGVTPARDVVIPAGGRTLEFPIAFGGAAELPAILRLVFGPTPFPVGEPEP